MKPALLVNRISKTLVRENFNLLIRSKVTFTDRMRMIDINDLLRLRLLSILFSHTMRRVSLRSEGFFYFEN